MAGCGRVLDQFQPKTDCLAMSAATLAAVHGVSILAASLQKLIDECFVELLIFGCNGSTEQTSALSWLKQLGQSPESALWATRRRALHIAQHGGVLEPTACRLKLLEGARGTNMCL